MFPYLNPQSIKNVNDAPDHPTIFQRSLTKVINQNKRYSPIPFPGLSRRGHTYINHDMTSALMTGYAIGGPDGVLAAYAHLAEDAMSDLMARTLTTEGGDVAEAIYNYNRRHTVNVGIRRRRYKKNEFGF